jgi:hypothetical protein
MRDVRSRRVKDDVMYEDLMMMSLEVCWDAMERREKRQEANLPDVPNSRPSVQ